MTQRLPQRTMDSTRPTPGMVSPRAAIRIPSGPSRTAVPSRTSTIVQPGIVAGLVFAVLAARGKSKSAGEALYTALRAEAVKLVLMVLLLWFVLATYRDVVAIGLIGTFIATVLIFTMAILVREK